VERCASGSELRVCIVGTPCRSDKAVKMLASLWCMRIPIPRYICNTLQIDLWYQTPQPYRNNPTYKLHDLRTSSSGKRSRQMARCRATVVTGRPTVTFRRRRELWNGAHSGSACIQHCYTYMYNRDTL
jgi:hypothetical protein